MILGYSEIIRQAEEKNLLSKYEEANLLNSSYKLRVGKIFIPEDGTVVEFPDNTEKDTLISKIRTWLADFITPKHNCKNGIPQWILSNNHSYTLKPREIILFQTLENIKMPPNIMGMYCALNTVAQKGILLINASMVEANYEGPLSGILLNFSNVNFEITPNMDIAKISFLEIKGKIKDADEDKNRLQSEVKDDKGEQPNYDEYSIMLREKAKNVYSKTFLSISQLSDEIENKVVKTVERNFTIGA